MIFLKKGIKKSKVFSKALFIIILPVSLGSHVCYDKTYKAQIQQNAIQT
jgi:hypothetical protein